MSKIKSSEIKTLILVFLLLSVTSTSYSQGDIPSTTVKTTRGKSVKFNSLCQARDTVILVTFWATWCNPCVNELEKLNEIFPEWQKECPVILIAVSVDDARTSARVNSFVKGRGWNFNVFLDPNNDLKRAFNINDIPYLLMIKNDRVVYQKSGYIPGSESGLLSKLKSL